MPKTSQPEKKRPMLTDKRRKPTYTALREVEYAMLRLSTDLVSLFKQADSVLYSSFDEISSSADLPADVQSLIRKPRIKLAYKLLWKYRNGKLDILGDILNTLGDKVDEIAMSTSETGNSAAYHGGNTERPSDEFLIDGNKVWPPPLPQINDSDLKQVVFTHRSYLQSMSQLKAEELMARHNERLEFLGDSVLGYFVSDVLFRRYPTADQGVLTIRKAELVCNNTLWEFTMAYGLYDKLRSMPKLPELGPDGKKAKAPADLFEAYIGGLVVDQGLEVTRNWLLELYAPLLDLFDQNPLKEVDKQAKADLYRKIGSAEQKIEYVVVVQGSSDSPFTVNCVIGDDVLGTGSDKNTKQASLKAAAMALTNHEKIEYYAEKRRQIPRTAEVTGSAKYM